MRITAIAAMSRNRVIGIGDRLPWRLPRDLRRFRELTMGKPVVMGRRTMLSIGKPLAGRRNIVLTHDPGFGMPGCEVAHGLRAALDLAAPADEAMIIGGATVYREALPLCQRLHLTLVDADIQGDVFFPDLEEHAWEERDREVFEADEANAYRLFFLTYERINA